MIGNKPSIYNAQSVYNQGGGGGEMPDIPGIDFVEIGDKQYPFKIMPDGKKWTMFNLDLTWEGLPVGSPASTSEQRANYYNNDQNTYGWGGKKYGLLYNFTALVYLNNHKADLIPGWRVPTKSDWETLKTILGSNPGAQLKAIDFPTNPGFYDLFGFAATSSGQRDYYGNFSNVGANGIYSTVTNAGGSNWHDVWFDGSTGLGIGSDDVKVQNPVRLIED